MDSILGWGGEESVKRKVGYIGLIPACLVIAMIWLLPLLLRGQRSTASFDTEIKDHVNSMFEEGKRTFRFETFGDEAFWGDTLKLHRAIAGQKLGGVGAGLSPKKALD